MTAIPPIRSFLCTLDNMVEIPYYASFNNAFTWQGGHDVLIYAAHIILRQFAARNPRNLSLRRITEVYAKPVVSNLWSPDRWESVGSFEGSPGGNRESRAAAGRLKRAGYGTALAAAQG